MRTDSPRRLTEIGLIAALYTVLTLVCQPIAFGPIQLRLSEALTVLPLFTPTAIPGLAVGCALSNALCIGANPAGAWDVLFGPLATLLAAVLTRVLRNTRLWEWPIPAVLMPVAVNAAVIGPELSVIYFGFSPATCLLCMAEIAAGELITAGLGGLLLWRWLPASLFSEPHD